MKNTLILMLLTVFQVFANDSYSQNTTLTLNLNDVTVENVLNAIETQSEFYFLCNKKLVDIDRKVSIQLEDQNIGDILAQIFNGTDVGYVVIDRQIVISPGEYLAKFKTKLQPITITGKVTDENGEPLPGVAIVVKGSTTGAITDSDGNYAINIPEGGITLVFSFVGMKTQEVIIGNQTTLDIVLESEIIGLEEVVVIGYGTVKKSDLTGSVASIKEKEINVQAARSISQMLTGLATGVQVRQNSGAPGSSLSVIIRGGNSLLGGNAPLYVVDGSLVIGGAIPSNVQSIEILKDASATAIYGSRGANGVILITTKEGKEGKTSVEYNGYYGIQKVTKYMDMLNAKEFATLANTRASNDGETLYFSDQEIASFGEGTNWQDEIFQIAPIQDHTLTVSGGNNKTKFHVLGNYFRQEGIMINSGYQRYQFSARFQHKISPNWKIFVDNVLSRTTSNKLYSDNTSRAYGVLSAALSAPPTLTPYDDQGNYTDIRQYPFSEATSNNPVTRALEEKDLTKRTSGAINLVVEGQLLKNLIFKSSLGANYSYSRRDYYESIKNINSSGDASINYGESTNIVNENTLTYSTEISENHKFTILGGITAQKSIGQSLRGSSNGYLTDVLENYSLQSGSNYGTPVSGYSEYSILSFFGRIDYAYKGKYLITSSIRADGSSRFGKDNKWGYFPSAALAWRVSEEDFWDNFVSNFKIRGSWGKTGNTAISPYQSLSTLSSVQVVFDNDIYIGYAPSSTKSNSGLKWETTEQFNIGTDIGLFNDQLFFTIDYYHKNTHDLLAMVPLPTSTGYTYMTDNVGSIQNKGFEIAALLKVVSGSFNWDIGANISINQNKVLSLSQGADIYGSRLSIPLNLSVNLVREGYPVGVFYGLVEDGLTEDGSIKYVDYDNSGEINSLDRQIIGDPNPNYIFGINSFMNFKSFGLTILIDGVQGYDVFNATKGYIADGFSFGLNNIKDVLGNYWTEENPNPNAKYPRISANTRYDVSDRYVEDGSYIRIKNVQLSYTLNGGKFKTSPLKNSQIYLGVQNLLTLTNYSGYSSEVNTAGTGISKGVDQTGYPIARVVMLGIRIKL